ncbi:Nonribosomal peptide synthetase dtxS1 [Paramyrothecium foliicola]|nr:Nonribosomal peptide synthetase dtxS1 [Paramyrothecium foliicola]
MITKDTDIVCGRVVNGRNSTIERIHNIIGQCAQLALVRTQLLPSQTILELLNPVQEQYLAMGEADSMGALNIAKHYTDWKHGFCQGTMVQHVSLDSLLKIRTMNDDAVVRLVEHPNFMIPALYMASSFKDEHLTVESRSISHVLEEEAADALLSMVSQVIMRISTG